MSNPLTAIDELVTHALTEFSGLTAIVPPGKIQAWDRMVDIRGEVEDASDLRGRVWIVPGRSELDLGYGNWVARHVRGFSIGFGCGGLKLSECRDIERQVQRAMARLNALQQADGVTPIVQPSPLEIESVAVHGTDPEREPIDDPSEWRDVCDIIVIAIESKTDLMGVT